YGPGLLGQLHDRVAEGVVRASAEAAAFARAGRAGLRNRNRPARRTDRQTGSIYRGVRRCDLLLVPPRRQRRCPAAEVLDGDALQSRRQPAVVLYRLLTVGRQHSAVPEDPHGTERPADAPEPALHQRAELPEPDGAGGGTNGGIRRADARALGAQETALQR